MHVLAFLEPGHFHAALTLRERHPRVREEIFVYAPAGPELDDFLALIDAFNRRRERPTAWRPIVRAGSDPLERLLAERPGNIVILAGRNDRKAKLMRRCHDAGFHVLADKPWLVGADGLGDLRHVLADGSLAVEIMTGRHEITSILTARLVADREVFGGFAEDAPGIEMTSVHHLEKTVNGARLRRPSWYFDVRVQGDGLADIPTHMVDAAQRLVGAATARVGVASTLPLLLIAARRWSTKVPQALFSRITGLADFPAEIRPAAPDSTLDYECNAELSFRAGGVIVALKTRWEPIEPAGGGDASVTIVRGGRAEIRVEQSAETGFRRRLLVMPRRAGDDLSSALARALAAGHAERPGAAIAAAASGWEIKAPPTLDTGHESHFPLVLADFLALVERDDHPASFGADTLAKYELLAQAARSAPRS